MGNGAMYHTIVFLHGFPVKFKMNHNNSNLYLREVNMEPAAFHTAGQGKLSTTTHPSSHLDHTPQIQAHLRIGAAYDLKMMCIRPSETCF